MRQRQREPEVCCQILPSFTILFAYNIINIILVYFAGNVKLKRHQLLKYTLPSTVKIYTVTEFERSQCSLDCKTVNYTIVLH